MNRLVSVILCGGNYYTGFVFMRVKSTRHSLQFYKRDGWTNQKLRACLLKGKLARHHDGTNVFWSLAPNSKLDPGRLAAVVTRVDRWYNDFPRETDRQYLNLMAHHG